MNDKKEKKENKTPLRSMFSQKENESKYPVNRQIYTACSSKVQFHDILLSGFRGASCADKKRKTNRKKQQQIKKKQKKKKTGSTDDR